MHRYIMLSAIFLIGFSPLKGVKRFTLPNGMRCLLKENHDQPIASVQVWVRTGSINENDSTNGISHVFEHMVFKGTQKYPKGEISRIVEANGGMINAATSLEYTFYYIDIPSTALHKALSIMSDAMMHCTFPEEELIKERKVILEEFNRQVDMPQAKLFDNLNAELYEETP
ncbi:MAG: pitrilysin family protein, partial [bacterium]